jgi:integrase
MATVCAKVLKHHLKADGTYNVKIRIFHKNEKRYFDSEHYVTDKQLTRKMEIKDPFVNQLLHKKLINYRVLIGELGGKLDFFTCEQLRDYLVDSNKEINFIEFCDEHVHQLKIDGREGTAANHTTVRNSLVDYFKRDKIAFSEISAVMLKSYARFLRAPRKMERINQMNKIFIIEKVGLSDVGLYNHMRDLRTLFNAAREKYNDEDLGIIKIPHYPFKKYKIGSPPQTRKRNIPLKVVRSIRDCDVEPGGRAELARDLFMLSFYMCGMNAVDLYYCNTENIRKGRLEYNRSKTKERRKDKAFISVKILAEAKPLLEKYLGKLPLRYSTYKGLDTALSKGMKLVTKSLDIPAITFYWGRHTFANSARNDCRMSKDDIALALNHVDHGHQTTDIYISKDWKIVDEVQAKVIAMLIQTK